MNTVLIGDLFYWPKKVIFHRITIFAKILYILTFAGAILMKMCCTVAGPTCFHFLQYFSLETLAGPQCRTIVEKDLFQPPRLHVKNFHRRSIQSRGWNLNLNFKTSGPKIFEWDSFFNLWTYDESSKAWLDEYGGKCFGSSSGVHPIIEPIHTPDGKIWGMQHNMVWVSSSGDVMKGEVPAGSTGWTEEFRKSWASSCGDLTLEWPSRRWQRMQASGDAMAVPSSIKVVFDDFFNRWTYDEKQRAWFDEHGGKTIDNPRHILVKQLITSDGNVWRYENRWVWTSKTGQYVVPKPEFAPDAEGWEFKRVTAWFSSSNVMTFGWPSKELKEQIEVHPTSSASASSRIGASSSSVAGRFEI
jgi:hypothetical protein